MFYEVIKATSINVRPRADIFAHDSLPGTNPEAQRLKYCLSSPSRINLCCICFDTCACMSTSLSIPCIHIQMFSDTISRPITTKLKCLHSRHLLSTALLRLAIVSPPSFSRSHVTQTRNRNQTHAHTHHTYTHTHSHVNFLRSLSYLPPFKFFFQPCFSTSQHIMHDYVTYIHQKNTLAIQ